MNALLYMGIMENANPHPSDTFQVTLRGETAIQYWTQRSEALKKASQSQKDAIIATLNSIRETRKKMHAY